MSGQIRVGKASVWCSRGLAALIFAALALDGCGGAQLAGPVAASQGGLRIRRSDSATTEEQGTRRRPLHALVVGNAAYTDRRVGALENPVRDASAVAQALRDLGYDEVLYQSNLGLSALTSVVAAFRASLPRDALAVFYFAGHGVEIDRRNYIVPVDFAMPSSPEMARRAAYDVQDIIATLASGRAGYQVLILDACRNNPLGEGGASSGLSGGFSEAALRNLGGEVARSTVTWTSASPGREAPDGPAGSNSPFTAALVEMLRTRAQAPVQIFYPILAREIERRSQARPWGDTQAITFVNLLGEESENVDDATIEDAGEGAADGGSPAGKALIVATFNIQDAAVHPLVSYSDTSPDVARMQWVYAQLGIARPVVLRDEAASLTRIRQELARMLARATPGDHVAFHFSGYALTTQSSGPVLFASGADASCANGCLPVSEFERWVAQLRARLGAQGHLLLT